MTVRNSRHRSTGRRFLAGVLAILTWSAVAGVTPVQPAHARGAGSAAITRVKPPKAVPPQTSKKSTPAPTSPGKAAGGPERRIAPGMIGGSYWLNSKTGIYHQSGCRYYQTTEYGVMVSMADAPRMGKACGLCLSGQTRGVGLRLPSAARHAPKREKTQGDKAFVLE